MCCKTRWEMDQDQTSSHAQWSTQWCCWVKQKVFLWVHSILSCIRFPILLLHFIESFIFCSICCWHLLMLCVLNDLSLKDNGSDQGDCEWPVTEFMKPLANPLKIGAKPLTLKCWAFYQIAWQQSEYWAILAQNSPYHIVHGLITAEFLSRDSFCFVFHTQMNKYQKTDYLFSYWNYHIAFNFWGVQLTISLQFQVECLTLFCRFRQSYFISLHQMKKFVVILTYKPNDKVILYKQNIVI